METLGGSSSGDESSYIFKYHNEENIQYFKIDVDIINIGSGVAYDLDVKLSLPGLKYSRIEEDKGVSEYVGGEYRGTTYYWTDNFYFSGIILGPHGGDETIGLNIPFEEIRSIENLPKSCTITVEDITDTILLERTWVFDYTQY